MTMKEITGKIAGNALMAMATGIGGMIFGGLAKAGLEAISGTPAPNAVEAPLAESPIPEEILETTTTVVGGDE